VPRNLPDVGVEADAMSPALAQATGQRQLPQFANWRSRPKAAIDRRAKQTLTLRR